MTAGTAITMPIGQAHAKTIKVARPMTTPPRIANWRPIVGLPRTTSSPISARASPAIMATAPAEAASTSAGRSSVFCWMTTRLRTAKASPRAAKPTPITVSAWCERGSGITISFVSTDLLAARWDNRHATSAGMPSASRVSISRSSDVGGCPAMYASSAWAQRSLSISARRPSRSSPGSPRVYTATHPRTTVAATLGITS